MTEVEVEGLYRHCAEDITDGEKLVKVFRRLTTHSDIRPWRDDRLGIMRQHLLGEAVLKSLGNMRWLASLTMTEKKAALRFFDPQNFDDQKALDSIVCEGKGEDFAFYAGELFDEKGYPIYGQPSGKFGFSIRMRCEALNGSRDILLSNPVISGAIRVADMLEELKPADTGKATHHWPMIDMALRFRAEKPPFNCAPDQTEKSAGWQTTIEQIMAKEDL